ncbi:hypothetical protein C4K29_2074 [Pseudomonas chlororaphis subsp. piscium]|uniref:hypothetical protein n=1 Tax=Pseudomonas chlororaphis TaxID=587753 RepID=UPI000F568F4C|nr:hypothetical protein [Pseudomonas chlororaphis]AZC88377.1 hypothetical protein C4K29_2074 [Pseudomonas chlororaphis subsp. piscium]
MEQTASKQPVDTRRYRTSWRLTFRFDGQEVWLVRRELLQKVAPGTTPDAPTLGKNSGAWLEVLDPSGQRLFHRHLSDPLRTRAEHHSPDGRIELHVRTPEPCEFTVIVPDIPGASDVALYSSPNDRERMLDPARAIGRYALAEPKSDDDSSKKRRRRNAEKGP